jgi:hypothetical protein
LHASHLAHRIAAWSLAATVGVALLLASPALSQAEESNPNNYNCLGSTAAGQPEAGSDEQQVQYTFYCNGPITGYQVQSQIPVTGVSSPPAVANLQTTLLPETFSCSGEVPGWVAIASKLCAEPRVDPLLTVTYAYLEKGAVTQAISGPYDLGRPKDCKADAYSGFSRFSPKPLTSKRAAKKGAKGTSKAVKKKAGAKK